MAATFSRRGLIGGVACCALGAPSAARIMPATMQPLVPLGYTPVDTDERGLWQSLSRFEEELATSTLLLKSSEMQAYVEGVMRRLLGPRANETRIYIVHDPSFNASMFPNGLTVVQTGLLVRVRNEAQLAAVLGHEAGHYLRRHSVAAWRMHKRTMGMMAFVTVGTNAIAGISAINGGDARSWIDLANSVNSQLFASMFAFDREQESEADAFGLRLVAEAGYSPDAPAAIWQQLNDERRASAAARSKRYHDDSRSPFASHPPNDVRMLDLATSAREMPSQPAASTGYHDGRREWLRAVTPIRSVLLDEQVKLNDPGTSLYLVNSLAAGGWDGPLHYYAGEAFRLRDAPGDAALAADAYAAAVALPDAPTEAWRANGYALIKAGRRDEGHLSLARYLDLAPLAADAAMVRFSLAQ